MVESLFYYAVEDGKNLEYHILTSSDKFKELEIISSVKGGSPSSDLIKTISKYELRDGVYILRKPTIDDIDFVVKCSLIFKLAKYARDYDANFSLNDYSFRYNFSPYALQKSHPTHRSLDEKEESMLHNFLSLRNNYKKD